MDQEQFCQNCSQRRNCRAAYEQLGKTRGPSVVSKVVAAFLLPIVFFIAALVTFEKILARAIETKELGTAVGFGLALSATFLLILITKAVNIRLNKKIMSEPNWYENRH